VQRRTAVESVILMLRWTINVSRSGRVLRCIAADESVEPEMRGLAAEGSARPMERGPSGFSGRADEFRRADIVEACRRMTGARCRLRFLGV
jgi:hypothetical protein